MEIRMPDEIRQVIANLEDAGFSAWLVGGSVRDCLLGITPKDWDIATSAPQDTAQQVLMSYARVVPVGAKFGTNTVVFPKLKSEVSTLRGRCLIEDLALRDFTINALAWHPRWGLINPHGGQRDLEARLIRCPGDPGVIFKADPLRMLRAIRFVCQLDFAIHEGTMEAISTYHSRIAEVSAERVREELNAFLLSSRPAQGFDLMRKTGLLAYILPELQECVGFDQKHPNHDKDVYQHILAVVENSPPKLIVRLAALFHDIGKPLCLTIDEKGIGHFYGHEKDGAQLAVKIMNRLKYDKDSIATVKTLVREHMLRINYPKMNPAKLLARVGRENIEYLFALQEADAKGGTGRSIEPIQEMRELVEKALAEKRPFSRADLAITGQDLIKDGVEPGPEVGRILDLLVERVIKDPQYNTPEKLMEIAKRSR